MRCVLAAVFLFLALMGPVLGQQWEAVGCDLPAIYKGINIKEVCSRLGIRYRSTFGPDRSPWVQIASASDCEQVRNEVSRLLSGVDAPGEVEAQDPEYAEPSPSGARRETEQERWLRENGYASMAEAEADRSAAEKKWRQGREARERSDRETFSSRMRLLEQELRHRIALQDMLVAAELERKRQMEQADQEETGAIPAEAWEEPLAMWKSELLDANKEVEATRQALLKLVKGAEADMRLFSEWELEAQAGLERSWKAIFDLAMDAGMGMFAEGANGWAAYAKGPGAKASPEALEEYRLLFSLIDRLKEAKSIRDLSSFAANEGKTGTEVLEMVRDSLVQLSGLLGVEETFPGRVLKYGALFTDQAYNYTALFQVWKSIGALEKNGAAQSEAIRKLSERLHQLVDRQQELVKKIEAGEKVKFKE